MRSMLIAPFCLTALLGACAEMGTDVDPILDGPPNAQFQSDLSACRSLARSQTQLDHETLAAIVLGAGIGGLLGEADEGDALGGALAGAVAGAAAGVAGAADTREAVVLNCLRGRGHAVVN
ncbi:hypothetical protein OG2516_05643 [Oceanicola granulosus HTCC2516]|uniref:Glycine zipper domain-containing protein n=1 Tax=Oceanicola granulosus (strain ATCC BAA-861 / DSM 15982 / KCTC 12143 / HTCC2516) TaxID=314256 RepID=Q2CIM3_OCEGH|nr:glycine zipper family protein [Oceanicola granulosus]EAR52566.1 hypothetical protein OG2516_05643 [Oceanicola granulosus HTCC2516]